MNLPEIFKDNIWNVLNKIQEYDTTQDNICQYLIDLLHSDFNELDILNVLAD